MQHTPLFNTRNALNCTVLKSSNYRSLCCGLAGRTGISWEHPCNLDEPARGLFSHGQWCDNSEESDWPTAATRSTQFQYVNEWEWHEANHVVQTCFGTSLLHSLIWQPIGSAKNILSAANMRPWTSYILRSWFGWQQKTEISMSSCLLASFSKIKVSFLSIFTL